VDLNGTVNSILNSYVNQRVFPVPSGRWVDEILRSPQFHPPSRHDSTELEAFNNYTNRCLIYSGDPDDLLSAEYGVVGVSARKKHPVTVCD